MQALDPVLYVGEVVHQFAIKRRHQRRDSLQLIGFNNQLAIAAVMLLRHVRQDKPLSALPHH